MTQSSEPLDAEQSASAAATAPANGPTSEHATDRDLQRSALRDLVELATGCAATEVQIESRCESEVAAAEKELTATREELASKLESLRASVQQKHDERVTEAQAQLDFDARQLKEADLATRSRLAAEHEAGESDVRQKLDQAV